MTLTAGEVLDGKYRLVRELGRGGHGLVWLAVEVNLNREVAIKTLHEDAAEGSKALFTRLQREGSLLATLQDLQGLPKVFGFFSEGSAHYLVLEYIQGSNLATELNQRRRFTDEDVVAIGLQTAAILTHLHQQGLLHLDVKPDNLARTQGGSIKLVDFGIAAPFKRNAAAASLSDRPTVPSTRRLVAGTHGYAAPEQYEGGLPDETSDVYGLGATLYKLASGSNPPDALARPPNDRQQVMDHLVAAGTDAWLAGVIARAMAVDPSQRYQHAADVQQDLQPEPVVQPPSSGGRGRLVGAAALVVAAIIAAILLLRLSPTTTPPTAQPTAASAATAAPTQPALAAIGGAGTVQPQPTAATRPPAVATQAPPTTTPVPATATPLPATPTPVPPSPTAVAAPALAVSQYVEYVQPTPTPASDPPVPGLAMIGRDEFPHSLRFVFELGAGGGLGDETHSATYQLPGRFDRFQATIALEPGATEGLTFEVFADGSRKYVQVVGINDPPGDVDVDIQGARQLQLSLTTANTNRVPLPKATGIWGDATLVGQGSPQTPTPVAAATLGPTTYSEDLSPQGKPDPPLRGVATIAGQSFQHSLRFVFPQGSGGGLGDDTRSATVTLGRRFQAFQASLGLEQGATEGLTFEVFADGRRLYVQRVNPGDAPQPIDLDVRGVSQLRLAMTTANTRNVLLPKVTGVWGDAVAIGQGPPPP